MTDILLMPSVPPAADAHVVLDVSTSMTGDSLVAAIRRIQAVETPQTPVATVKGGTVAWRGTVADLDEDMLQEQLGAGGGCATVSPKPSVLHEAAAVLRTPPMSDGDSLDADGEAFLEAVEGNRDAVLDSDVDGLKGRFALKNGGLVQIFGDTSTPFRGGAPAIRAIMADGAYSIEAAR